MSSLTFKQGALILRYTGLKMWEAERMPPPTISEASTIIGLLMDWGKAEGIAKDSLKSQIVAVIKQWFPEWDGSTLKKAWFGKRKSKPEGESASASVPETSKPEHKPEQPETSKPEGANEPEPERKAEAEQAESDSSEQESEVEPEPELPAPASASTEAEVIALIQAGIDNIWLHGPSGSGKTTICRLIGKHLGLPVTVVSCSLGTAPSEFLGYKFPERAHSPASFQYGTPGILVLDEMPMLDAQTASACNAMLANAQGESLQTAVGAVPRACIIIATGNTLGNGANRQYCGNQQLDASTLNRFAGAMIEVPYSQGWEMANCDKAVCKYVWKLREVISTHGLRRIASTRHAITGSKRKAAGLEWKESLVSDWTEAERALLK
jgi:hypothetical protein